MTIIKKIVGWGKEVVKGFLDNNCAIHAAGLTYFAMLALIPVLCFILVAAKACHVDHYTKAMINTQIDTFIENIEKGQDDVLATWMTKEEEERERKRIAAEEFAQTARKITNTLFSRVENFDVGTLGWIGFALLMWTIISSLGTVEISFNQIWGVAAPRPIWKRAYIYLFIIVLLPILATLALSLPILNVVKHIIILTLGTTSLTQWFSEGLIWLLDSFVVRGLFTLATASLAFGFFYWIIPNCNVCWRHAWYGGLITTVLFGGWLKACAIAQVGIAKSSALYGSFAFFPIVLAWLYMSWQIVLLGANMVRSFDK